MQQPRSTGCARPRAQSPPERARGRAARRRAAARARASSSTTATWRRGRRPRPDRLAALAPSRPRALAPSRPRSSRPRARALAPRRRPALRELDQLGASKLERRARRAPVRSRLDRVVANGKPGRVMGVGEPVTRRGGARSSSARDERRLLVRGHYWVAVGDVCVGALCLAQRARIV